MRRGKRIDRYRFVLGGDVTVGIRTQRNRLGILAALVALALPAAAEARRNVYVTSAAAAPVGLAAFDIGSDGAMTPLVGSPFGGAGTSPSAVTMSPDGSRVYVTDSNVPTTAVSVLNVDSATGLVSPLAGSPFADALSPQALTITADGRFLYTAKFSNQAKVSGFTVAADGSLAPVPGSPFDAGAEGTNQGAVVATPDGRRLYVANTNAPNGNISAFTIGTNGALTPVQGSPFASGATSPADLVVTPDGKRLYSANIGNGGSISAFDIGTTGALTAITGSPFSSGGTFTIGATLTPDGKRLYVSNRAGESISGFSVADDGSLSHLPGSPKALGAGTGPSGIQVTPDGSRLYVAEFGTDKVFGFDIGADGSLAAVPGSPVASGVGGPPFESLVITPNQPPVAAFNATPAPAGEVTTFDAGPSIDTDGVILRYDWEFGDGTSLPDGGPTPQHIYEKARSYTATLTLTDNEGCSRTRTYTGQVVLCNGGSGAQIKQPLTVPDIVDPSLRLRGPRKQPAGTSVKVKVVSNEVGSALAEGTLTVQGAGGKTTIKAMKLRRARGKVFPGRTETLQPEALQGAASDGPLRARARESGGRPRRGHRHR